MIGDITPRAHPSSIQLLPSRSWRNITIRVDWCELTEDYFIQRKKLMELGGWKSLSMVQRYAHVNPDNMRLVIGLLPTLETRTKPVKPDRTAS